jgi:hypothetical protein
MTEQKVKTGHILLKAGVNIPKTTRYLGKIWDNGAEHYILLPRARPQIVTGRLTPVLDKDENPYTHEHIFPAIKRLMEIAEKRTASKRNIVAEKSVEEDFEIEEVPTNFSDELEAELANGVIEEDSSVVENEKEKVSEGEEIVEEQEATEEEKAVENKKTNTKKKK